MEICKQVIDIITSFTRTFRKIGGVTMSESDKRLWFMLGVLTLAFGILIGMLIVVEQQEEIREQKNILQTEVNTYRSLLLEVQK